MSSQETTFYQSDNILITNTRAVLRNDTYAMANITSVRARVKPPNRVIGIVVSAVGGLMTTCCGCSALGVIPMLAEGGDEFIGTGLAGGGAILAGAIFGLLVLAGGIALIIMAKPTYVVVIGTAGREVDAIPSRDQDYIATIVSAMNEAIIHRG
jgi:hypothetical protein